MIALALRCSRQARSQQSKVCGARVLLSGPGSAVGDKDDAWGEEEDGLTGAATSVTAVTAPALGAFERVASGDKSRQDIDDEARLFFRF